MNIQKNIQIKIKEKFFKILINKILKIKIKFKKISINIY